MVSKSVEQRALQAYWKANLQLVAGLLVVWFVASFGFGILLVDWLNRFSIAGMKLGFFFAQPGSIYVFVALIFVYVIRMNHLDHRFGVAEE